MSGEFKIRNRNEETNLVGYITHAHESINTPENNYDFLLELEAVMTKHKVVKVDACFDPFKMIKSKSND